MEEMKNGKGSFSGGVAFSAVVFAYLVLNFIFSLICVLGKISAQSDAVTYINYLLAPAAVAAAIPVVLKKRNVTFKSLMPVKSGLKYYVIGALLSFGLLFTLSWLNVGFKEILTLFGYSKDITYFPDISGGLVVLAVLIMAVIPAVFEETLFRGVILNNMESEAGTLKSVFISGFCFALFHASAVQTVYQFACGCAFALLAVRSRSVVPCMLAHFLNNAVIIILQASGLDTSGTIFDWAPLWVAVLVTVLSALSLAAALIWLILDKKDVYRTQTGGIKNFFIPASVGIIVLSVIWIVNLF